MVPDATRGKLTPATDPERPASGRPRSVRVEPCCLVSLNSQPSRDRHESHNCTRAQAPCRTPSHPIGRRRTGGEHPATRQQQPTRNDSRRHGQGRYRSTATGHEMTMLVFTRQRSAGRQVDCQPSATAREGGRLPTVTCLTRTRGTRRPATKPLLQERPGWWQDRKPDREDWGD